MDVRNEAIERLHNALAEHFSIAEAQVLLSQRGLPLTNEALVILSPDAMHLIAHLLEGGSFA